MIRSEGRPPARRRVLGAIGAAAVAASAGCLGLGGDDGDDGDGPSREPYTIDDHPIDEPVDFDDRQACPVCNMRVERYRDWRAQLAHEDGTGLFFDTPGCCFAYYVTPESFEGLDEPIAAVWLTDFERRTLFEASEGYLVRETDLDRQEFPMGGSPIPFADRADAEAYVAEYDDLADDEIVTLEDVDRSFAEFYRGGRM